MRRTFIVKVILSRRSLIIHGIPITDIESMNDHVGCANGVSSLNRETHVASHALTERHAVTAAISWCGGAPCCVLRPNPPRAHAESGARAVPKQRPSGCARLHGPEKRRFVSALRRRPIEPGVYAASSSGLDYGGSSDGAAQVQALQCKRGWGGSGPGRGLKGARAQRKVGAPAAFCGAVSQIVHCKAPRLDAAREVNNLHPRGI